MARGRRRSIAGWSLVWTGVAFAGILVASGWLSFSHKWVDGRRYGEFRITQGVIEILRGDDDNPYADGLSAIYSARWASGTALGGTHAPWTVHLTLATYDPIFGYRHMPGLLVWNPQHPWAHGTTLMALVLWPLAAVPVVLGGLLIWSRRQAVKRIMARGCCPLCGYDLKGLTANAACPECGKNQDQRPKAEG